MIIGFCGYARAGKDESAKPLIERGFERVAFADAIKYHIAYIFDETIDWVNSNKSILRPLMVEIGRTGRAVNPDIWIDMVLPLLDPDKDYVITDVRYLNEIEAIRAIGGKVYLIERPNYGPANKEETNSFLEIFSKTSLTVIRNNSSKEDLHAEVLDAIGI